MNVVEEPDHIDKANLQLSLQKKWVDMAKVGVKTEDYRGINHY